MGIEDLSIKGLQALADAYDKWVATPEGKKRVEEIHEHKVFIIKPEELPEGWDLEDGGEDEGYVVYWNSKYDITLSIELSFDRPIHFNGKQSYKVTIEEEPEEDDEEYYGGETINQVIGEFDAEKDWKDAAQKAKDKALEYMKTLANQ